MVTCTVTLSLVLSALPIPGPSEVQKALERTRRMRKYQRDLMRKQRANGKTHEALA